MSHGPLSDPKVIGPGTWFALHTLAAHSKNGRDFFDDLKLVVDNFKCLDCRGHAQQYLATHPVDLYLNMRDKSGRLTGPFRFSWEFHNWVNRRLGKPLVDWETAWSAFSQPEIGVCPEGCGQEEADPHAVRTSAQRLPSRAEIFPPAKRDRSPTRSSSYRPSYQLSGRN